MTDRERAQELIPLAHARQLRSGKWSIYTGSGYRLGGGDTEEAAWEEVAGKVVPTEGTNGPNVGL